MITDTGNVSQKLDKGRYLKKQSGRSVSWPSLIVGKVSSQDQVTQTHPLPSSKCLFWKHSSNISQTHIEIQHAYFEEIFQKKLSWHRSRRLHLPVVVGANLNQEKKRLLVIAVIRHNCQFGNGGKSQSQVNTWLWPQDDLQKTSKKYGQNMAEMWPKCGP